jgi:hypothetical protein
MMMLKRTLVTYGKAQAKGIAGVRHPLFHETFMAFFIHRFPSQPFHWSSQITPCVGYRLRSDAKRQCNGRHRLISKENPLRGFGPETAGSCVTSACFRRSSFREFAICAPRHLRYGAENHATALPSQDDSDEEVALPDGTTEVCEHIHAELETADEPNLPDTIELWASRESGQAIRIVVRWNLAERQSGRESIVLTYQSDEPSLSDEWFTAEAHYQGRRIIMRVDSLGQPTFERP